MKVNNLNLQHQRAIFKRLVSRKQCKFPQHLYC